VVLGRHYKERGLQSSLEVRGKRLPASRVFSIKYPPLFWLYDPGGPAMYTWTQCHPVSEAPAAVAFCNAHLRDTSSLDVLEFRVIVQVCYLQKNKRYADSSESGWPACGLSLLEQADVRDISSPGITGRIHTPDREEERPTRIKRLPCSSPQKLEQPHHQRVGGPMYIAKRARHIRAVRGCPQDDLILSHRQLSCQPRHIIRLWPMMR